MSKDLSDTETIIIACAYHRLQARNASCENTNPKTIDNLIKAEQSLEKAVKQDFLKACK
jgi:hypothetical protein